MLVWLRKRFALRSRRAFVGAFTLVVGLIASVIGTYACYAILAVTPLVRPHSPHIRPLDVLESVVLIVPGLFWLVAGALMLNPTYFQIGKRVGIAGVICLATLVLVVTLLL